MQLTEHQKEVLISNLQLELDQRIAKLRFLAETQAAALRERIAMRIHRIPPAMRGMKITDLQALQNKENMAPKSLAAGSKRTFNEDALHIAKKRIVPNPSPKKGGPARVASAVTHNVAPSSPVKKALEPSRTAAASRPRDYSPSPRKPMAPLPSNPSPRKRPIAMAKATATAATTSTTTSTTITTKAPAASVTKATAAATKAAAAAASTARAAAASTRNVSTATTGTTITRPTAKKTTAATKATTAAAKGVATKAATARAARAKPAPAANTTERRVLRKRA